MSNRILVTGSAGFIGFHLCRRLLKDGYTVVGLDNINDYYDTKLKEDRLAILREWQKFTFYKIDLSNREQLEEMFTKEEFGQEDRIINLAAQAGVRYALINPDSYMQSNLIGFFNLLELARLIDCKHLLFASSSSVYGGNTKLPFSVHDNVDHPISLYAATKKSNELMAHVYSYTYGLPVTGLRFFTVYGPWGRPDLSLFIFTKAILAGEPLPVFNRGDMSRDFTYVDDIVEGIIRLLKSPPLPNPDWNGENPDPGTSWLPYRIYNIGNHESVNLLDFIKIIEETLGRKANLDLQPMQLGDVKATFADIVDLTSAVGFKPKTSIREGIQKFIEWYLDYYKVSH
ncbi:MAG: NAD-dependent epimerase [Candidatus Hatepunaea meridiana]|nr:NAD-dependent epimerase [Candidatus Hatepunaea meridiana]